MHNPSQVIYISVCSDVDGGRSSWSLLQYVSSVGGGSITYRKRCYLKKIDCFYLKCNHFVLAKIAALKLNAYIWAPDMSKVALLCKFCVVLADR